MGKIVRDIQDTLLGKRYFVYEDIGKDNWLYPLDLDFTLENEEMHYCPKDDAGIPIKVYESVGKQYNPTRVAAYGLANWNCFRKTNQTHYRECFMRSVDWFAAQDDGLWRYLFDLEGVRAPWISCMAQGEGISILARAYIMQQQPDFLAIAERALSPFQTDVAQGGVRSFLDSGDLFFEEFPGNRYAKNVLNGFLYAVVGIIELKRISTLSIISDLLAQLTNTLERNIHRWDLGYWSAYDLNNEREAGPRNACTAAYNSLHIAQLFYLSQALDSRILGEYAAKWNRYHDSQLCRIKAVAAKVKYRLLYPAQR
ncbi:MAG: D-glucuronyl C5-epimerase family protein [Sporomusaceae bacterium]|nr:D-glucuronyl C5-epimerase family protein [Sporomusaceae bacterium]